LVPAEQWQEHLSGVELQKRLGVPVEVRDIAGAKEWFDFNPRGIAGATFGPADGTVDPHGICLEYLRRAKALGVQVHLETELQSAHPKGGGWQLQTNRGVFETQYILNAGGAWAGEIGRRAGLEIPVQPARRMVFTTGPLSWHHNYPLTIDLSTGFWFRSEHDRLILGKSNLEDIGFAEGMDWNWLEPTLRAGLMRFPWLEKTSLDQKASWWGYYETTPDHNPILGKMPGLEGWVNACGFSGHGVQQAAMVGRLMAEEILDGKVHSLDIDSKRHERFQGEQRALERHIV
jgi:sarcosine oxidase subunit beta